MKKILIAGDSFASVWPNTNLGWVNLFSNNYSVTNLAQAGCGEYKILKQIESVDIQKFDLVIISHTSPSRVHTAQHPIHKTGFHKNCDLMANDIIDRNSWFNPSLRAAQDWFKYHYDDQFQIDIYKLIRKRILEIAENIPYVSLTHTEISKKLTIEKNNIDFSELWKNERGNINHYTVKGNEIIYNTIVQYINQPKMSWQSKKKSV